MVLPLMNRHHASFNPINYTVWYEHVAKLNAPLNHAMTELLESGKPLDDKVMLDLYQSYVAAFDNQESWRVQSDLTRILHDMFVAARSTGDRAQEYDESLKRHSDLLKESQSALDLAAVVNVLLGDTAAIGDSVSQLKRQLDSSGKAVADLRRALQQLRSEAVTDPLTGLLNRRGFDRAAGDVLAGAVPRREDICLIMSDIDHFKKVNDTHGHLFGDKVIQVVAQTIRSTIKGQDIAARLGGEEFAIVLPDTVLDAGYTVAEKIRKKIESGRIRHGLTGDTVGAVTMSLGVTSYQHGELFTDFLGRADEALYLSKRTGRNRTSVQ